MNEIWKDIEGFEGRYQISSEGRVKSLARTLVTGHKWNERILKSAYDKNGYLLVLLSKDGKHIMHKVHRLVAQAFIPNPNNEPEVNHIDGNKENNHVENLEWVSCSENIQHAIKLGLSHPHGPSGERHGKAKLRWTDVDWIRSHKNVGIPTLTEKFNVSESTIYRILNNQAWIKEVM